jgi:hypothetical protein
LSTQTAIRTDVVNSPVIQRFAARLTGSHFWLVHPCERGYPPVLAIPTTVVRMPREEQPRYVLGKAWGSNIEASQLGGGEDFFVGTAVEGEPLPAFAPEDGVPGAPVHFGAQEDSLFSTPFTPKDYLLGRVSHSYSFRPSRGPRLPSLNFRATRGTTSHTSGAGTR